MAYSTIQAAIDYYIDILKNPGEAAIVSPRIELMNPKWLDTNKSIWLQIKPRRNLHNNSIFAVQFVITNKQVGSIGEITLDEFSELEDDLDTAVGEFRRKQFKKISRQQRHLEEDNIDKRKNNK